VAQPKGQSGQLRNRKQGHQATGESGCLKGLQDIIRLGILDRRVIGVTSPREVPIRTRTTPDMLIKQTLRIIADKEAAVNSKSLRRKRILQSEIKYKSHANQL
jgi:hypothetical protein